VLYPEGPAICEHYAEQFTRLKDAGTPIGANDLWIVPGVNYPGRRASTILAGGCAVRS